MKKEKIRKEIRIASIILLMFIVTVSIFLVWNYEETRQYMANNIVNYGLLSIFIFVLVIEFLPQLLSPDFILLWGIGFGINVYSAVIVTMVASAIGSLMSFLLGYHYGFHTIAPFFKEKTVDKTVKFWNKHGKWFVLAAGTLPLPIPYFPLLFGALRMQKMQFILWGIIPRTLGFIATGIVGYYGFNGFLDWI